MNSYSSPHQLSFFSKLKYLPLLSTGTFLRTYYHTCKIIRQLQSSSSDKIKQYQVKRLQEILHHANQHVPYYQKIFSEKNIKPSSIQKISDITKIPLLTKQLIRKNLSTLKATNFPSNAFQLRSTGGTTGNPLHFYLEKAHWLGIHYAYNSIYMQQAGYHWNDKVVSITGINSIKMYHPFFRTLELSSFHTTSKYLNQYISDIKRFKPKFITSFPSALLLLTKYQLNQGRDLQINLQGIFCHGELLDSVQKKFLEDTYHCPVFDQYGHREQCVFATTCKDSSYYHVYPSYGLVEILDKDHQPVLKQNRKGEIIATSFTNSIFPFIRYKTEDLAEISNEACYCGSSYPLMKKIIGRTQEFIITANNEKIPLTGLYHIIAEQADIIKECQLFQDTPGKLIVNFVKDENTSEKSIIKMKQSFNKKLGSTIHINFRAVKEIQRTKYGKFQYLIQKIPMNDN